MVMMSKRIDNKIKKQKRNVSRLEKKARSIEEDLASIQDEHNSYRLDGDVAKIERFFDDFIISSLHDSICVERGLPLNKFSLKDLNHKFHLRQLHEEKEEELERTSRLLNIAKIDLILAQIKKVEEEA